MVQEGKEKAGEQGSGGFDSKGFMVNCYRRREGRAKVGSGG